MSENKVEILTPESHVVQFLREASMHVPFRYIFSEDDLDSIVTAGGVIVSQGKGVFLPQEIINDTMLARHLVP